MSKELLLLQETFRVKFHSIQVCYVRNKTLILPLLFIIIIIIIIIIINIIMTIIIIIIIVIIIIICNTSCLDIVKMISPYKRRSKLSQLVCLSVRIYVPPFFETDWIFFLETLDMDLWGIAEVVTNIIYSHLSPTLEKEAFWVIFAHFCGVFYEFLIFLRTV